jgi:hypothetical protein
MKKTVLLLALIFSVSTAFAVQPNPRLTPGTLCTPNNPDFAGYRYAAHIAYCNRNVSQAKKQQVAQAYGVPEAQWSNYEFDHLIPLNAGGSSDVTNLWPQPIAEAHLKDAVEQDVYNKLNAGAINQQQALKEIFDWIMQH